MGKTTKFLKEGNEIFYVDRYGRKWNKKCIDEIFEALTQKKKIDNVLDYYASEE